MIELIGKGKLRWYGHVKRMKEERTARRYLEMRVVGKRYRGRPRRRWTETVEEEVRRRGKKWICDVEEKKLCEDRKSCKRLINHTRATGVSTR